MRTWSVELEVNSWDDDLFNGTFEDCLKYCAERSYIIDGCECRLAEIEIDENGCVVFVHSLYYVTQPPIYSANDILEIYKLETEYLLECDKIAYQCSDEGYPSHGANYDLRCENARKYYDEQIDLITSKYEEE